MAATNNFTAGLDPTGEASLNPSELLQMVQLLAPTSTRGLVYYSNSAPSIVDNPELVRCVWLDTTTVPPTPKVYNTSSLAWVVQAVPDGGVSTTAKLADGIVTLAKLAGSEATGKGKYILRANAAGNGFELVAVTGIFDDGTLSLAKLVAGTDGHILRYRTSSGWTSEALNLASDINLLLNQISPSVIQTIGVSGAGRILQVGASGVAAFVPLGSVFPGNSLAVSTLAPGSGNGGKYIKVNAAGDQVVIEAGQPSINSYRSAETTIPGTDGTVTIAHGKATIIKARVCLFVSASSTPVYGYAGSDYVDLSGIGAGSSGYEASVAWDTTNVYVTANWASNKLQLWKRNVAAQRFDVDPANWKLVAFVDYAA